MARDGDNLVEIAISVAKQGIWQEIVLTVISHHPRTTNNPRAGKRGGVDFEGRKPTVKETLRPSVMSVQGGSKSGMYVDGSVCGVNVVFLVDTGANITIISPEV
ncbi:hypothetical protein HOLleu_26168 [Holothuria leucospilota]|uniref:Peptidase A2 domain-containing protein n=1 Tax=Holothuria leucospilota TaxID=206669 RepID=A0A9Q1BTX3_HOLLE|nr:hypothetical protein HOLleu_26168 [Holothuria leucospilota]